MDILFGVEERNQFGLMRFVGVMEEVPVGHVLLVHRGEHVAELFDIKLADESSGKLSLREFAEAFFRDLKNRGYTELWMRSEAEDEGDTLGFRLEEWDNSGWYPKYFFLREL